MTKKKKSRWIFGLLIIGLIAYGNPVEAQSDKNNKQNKKSSTEPVVTLTEYGDYQCPACGYYHSMVKKLKQQFDKKLKVKFQHFPLRQHQFAALAARAAEAARNQGKFWAMHNKLYANQKEWSRGNAIQVINRYAKSIGLNMEQFRQDLNSRKIHQKVMADKKRGVSKGVNSTPTFFLNGRMIKTARTYKAFKKKVVQAIKKAESSE